MGTFNDFLGKKKRDKIKISDTEKSYMTKIVDSVKSKINTLDPLTEQDIDRLVTLSFREILNNEMENIERQLNNSVLYATDSLKDQFRNLINKSIIHGVSKDEQHFRPIEGTSKREST